MSKEKESVVLTFNALLYYWHDGVLEQTNTIIEGHTHLLVTAVNGVPTSSKIIPAK